jgi:hypothetical protein
MRKTGSEDHDASGNRSQKMRPVQGLDFGVRETKKKIFREATGIALDLLV